MEIDRSAPVRTERDVEIAAPIEVGPLAPGDDAPVASRPERKRHPCREGRVDEWLPGPDQAGDVAEEARGFMETWLRDLKVEVERRAS